MQASIHCEGELNLFGTGHAIFKMTVTDAHGAVSDLYTLLQSMNPVLHDTIYVFATVELNFCYKNLHPVMIFQEQEGNTLIVSLEAAKSCRLAYEFPCQMITLNVHSALAAVGFLAEITRVLASSGIGVNTVSAFYHDHLFVPVDRAADAMRELEKMLMTNEQKPQ